MLGDGEGPATVLVGLADNGDVRSGNGAARARIVSDPITPAR